MTREDVTQTAVLFAINEQLMALLGIFHIAADCGRCELLALACARCGGGLG